MRHVLVESRLTRPPPPPVDTSEPNASDSSKLCLICMDNPINTIILPCGHQISTTSYISFFIFIMHVLLKY